MNLDGWQLERKGIASRGNPTARISSDMRLHLSKAACRMFGDSTHVRIYTNSSRQLALVPSAPTQSEAYKLASNGSGGRAIYARAVVERLSYQPDQYFDARKDGEMVVLTPREAQR